MSEHIAAAAAGDIVGSTCLISSCLLCLLSTHAHSLSASESRGEVDEVMNSRCRTRRPIGRSHWLHSVSRGEVHQVINSRCRTRRPIGHSHWLHSVSRGEVHEVINSQAYTPGVCMRQDDQSPGKRVTYHSMM